MCSDRHAFVYTMKKMRITACVLVYATYFFRSEGLAVAVASVINVGVAAVLILRRFALSRPSSTAPPTVQYLPPMVAYASIRAMLTFEWYFINVVQWNSVKRCTHE